MSLRLAIIMPRNMSFGPAHATSIDLVVHDIVTSLPGDVQVTVYAENNTVPYHDVTCQVFPRRTFRDRRSFLKNMADRVRADQPDVVVVEQHLPSAVSVARALPHIPVVLHAHAFPRLEKKIWKRAIQNWRYRHLRAVGFVSEACRADYDTMWKPATKVPSFVIPNGLDLSLWQPLDLAARDQTILCVGRMAPEKGIRELAQALARVLPARPGWRAQFILSGWDVHPAYRDTVMGILAPLGDRVNILTNRPWPEIRAANERAAIAVVPSTGPETFGKTALEALAGGAALISSIQGGIGEVVGDAAYRLDFVATDAITTALDGLIANPQKRADLAAKGHLQAQKYTVEAQVQAFLAMCRSVI